MSDHLLWVEVKDRVEQNTVNRAHSFFGHPSLTSSFYNPLMDGAYLLVPGGDKVNLEMRRGEWLPGYGHADSLFTDIMFFWPGDYVFSVARSPGVYDIGWHGGMSDPFLSYNFAKAVIHARGGSTGRWESDLPLELIPKQSPYDLQVGTDFNIEVKYLGQPVKANYNASYWTWDEHGDTRVLRGYTDEYGTFTVKLSQGGLWLIDAAYTLPEEGSWKATHSLANFYKSGDVLRYNSIRYKTTLSVWAR